jgi:hypothetical protein
VSSFLQIVSSDLFKITGLFERLVTWGDDELPTDPRCFVFSSLEMVLLPIPQHIRSILPLELGVHASGLQLADDITTQWASSRISTKTQLDLQRFFDAISASHRWAVTYERGSGTGIQTLGCAATCLFDVVDSTIRNQTDFDLTVIIPEDMKKDGVLCDNSPRGRLVLPGTDRAPESAAHGKKDELASRLVRRGHFFFC